MRTIKTFSLVSLLLTAGLSAGQPDDRPDKVIHEAPAEYLPFDANGVQKPAPIPISLDIRSAFEEQVNIHDLGKVSASDIEAADELAARNHAGAHPMPPRIGFARPIPYAPLSIENDDLVRTDLDDGRSVWTLAIRSPSAYGIRVHLSNFDVGHNQVIVYAHGDSGPIVRGPYTRKGTVHNGDFWSGSLPGDEVFVEYTGSKPPQFEIAEIMHFDHDLYGGDQSDADPSRESAVLACHEDVTCYPAFVSAAARLATGHMNYSSGGTGHLCTGTLINDKDDETYAPYFLTARHCISTASAATSLEVTWFYESDSCDGNVPALSTLPTTEGATIVRTYGENDMTLLRLASDLPHGIAFAGWTTATSINGWGIHHPAGSWKRTVKLHPVGTCLDCTCWDPTDYDYYDYQLGLTEPGSSGSAIFNSSGQIAGQLRGCCPRSGDCDNKNCSNYNNYLAVYGEFETTYDEINFWLVIGGTVHVNGAYPGAPGFPELGWEAAPFNTVIEGYNFAWPKARLKIQAGTYAESITFAKEMTIVGGGGDVIIRPAA